MGPLIPIAARALASASPGVMAKIANRVGAAVNPSAILAAMKNNPVTTALVGVELFGPASDFVRTVVTSNPEIAQLIEQISDIDYAPDAFEAVDDAKSGLLKYQDEFTLIENCSRILGGRDNFIQLRNALRISDEVLQMHKQVTGMGYRR